MSAWQSELLETGLGALMGRGVAPTPRQDLAPRCRGSAQLCSHGARNSSSSPRVWPRAACAHLVLPVTVITALVADGPFQTGIKIPLKQPDGRGYLYFWFSMAPLLHLHPMKGKEHPCLGSAGNCTQNGRNVSLRQNWEQETQTGEGCSAASTPSSQGPSGLPNGKCCPFKKPGSGLRQKHCLLNYHVQKQWRCQVSLFDCHPYKCQFLVGSEGSNGKSRDLSIAIIGVIRAVFKLVAKATQRHSPCPLISEISPRLSPKACPCNP